MLTPLLSSEGGGRKGHSEERTATMMGVRIFEEGKKDAPHRAILYLKGGCGGEEGVDGSVVWRRRKRMGE